MGLQFPGLECLVELGTGPDGEFPVDAAEVDFHGFGAHEYCGGDVAVGHAQNGQIGDAFFGGGQSWVAALA